MRDLLDNPTVLVASVGHFFSHLLLLLYPTVVLSLDAEFPGMSYGELLGLSTAGYVLFGVAALPAGWLGDRWSASRMLVLFFVGTGGATMLAGLADGPAMLFVALTLIGLFGSIYHPVGIAWVVGHSENRGRALGINGVFGSLGLGAAGLVAGGLSAAFGWRWAFLVPGCLCVMCGLAFAWSLRRVAARAKVAKPARAEPDVTASDMRRVFVILSVTMLGSGLVGQAIFVALPKAIEIRAPGLVEGLGLGVGPFVSVVFAVAAGVQLFGGWLADRLPLKRLYVGFWAAQTPTYLLAASVSESAFILAVCMAQFFMTLGIPAENLLLARYTPGRWQATAYGAKFVLALGIAAAAVPLVGAIYDRTAEFFWLFVVLGSIASLVTLAALLLPRERGATRELALQPAE